MTRPARVLRLTQVAVIILGRLVQGAYWLGTSTLLIGGYVYHDPVVVQMAWKLAVLGVGLQCACGGWPMSVIQRGVDAMAARVFGGGNDHA